MRFRLTLVLCILMLLLCGAALGESLLTVTQPEDTVRPGQAVLLSFDAPVAGIADLTLIDDQGETVFTVVEDFQAIAGSNSLWWNGTTDGIPAPEGSWELQVSLNDGAYVGAAPLVMGTYAPYLTGVYADSSLVTPDEPLTVHYYASCDGTMIFGVWTGGTWQEIGRVPCTSGSGEYSWTPGSEEEDGSLHFTLALADATGYESEQVRLPVTLSGFSEASRIEGTVTEPNIPEEELLEEVHLGDGADDDGTDEGEPEQEAPNAIISVNPDQSVYTPSYGSPYTGTDPSVNYWTLPMDITDEAAVWEMLMQPMTVLDTGKKNAQKTQIVLRREPDEDAKGVGVVTCVSQGVHVLETQGDWTLIECYSSSFHDSKVKAWNMLVQGWVPSKYIKTTKPNQEMGIVIDKLTQRLYLFKDGSLYDTLLVSTGLSNKKQPYNETRSGEFLLLLPAVGGFQDGNMICSMAIRFDGGDLLHEVPHSLAADGSNYYGVFEPYLGSRASHGCIRVQRKKTPNGVNMKWIWDNRQANIKLVIWEDWQGRQVPYPDDSTPVYYNPDGGSLYHSSEHCYSARTITFQPFTYGELEDDAYRKLKRCDYCNPPMRRADIDAINLEHVLGGDHDPILTEARQQYLNSLEDD